MQIPRIEAFNPNRINWQMLTAREILKYQQSGVEVPDVYLQWAQNFINNINAADNDDITYEKAMNAQNVQTEAETPPENAVEPQNNVEGDEPSESTDETENDNPEDNVQLSPAQQLRKQMNDDGVSLHNQAKSFKRTSKSLARDSFWNSMSLKGLKGTSDDEIGALEMHMRLLLSAAEDKQGKFKKEINKINSGSDQYSYSKIMELQRQLEQYGTKGQSEIAQSIGKLNALEANMNALGEIFPEAVDFGGEAISIGGELVAKSVFWDMILGYSTISAGDKAVRNGNSGEIVKQRSLSANDSNVEDAYALSSDVQSKTGVEALHKPEAREDEDNTDQSDAAKEREENSEDPALREQEIYKADSSSKASLDEILKRKIRRGEATEDVNS